MDWNQVSQRSNTLASSIFDVVAAALAGPASPDNSSLRRGYSIHSFIH